MKTKPPLSSAAKDVILILTASHCILFAFLWFLPTFPATDEVKERSETVSVAEVNRPAGDAKCHKCGMVIGKDMSFMLSSYPEQMGLLCKQCGFYNMTQTVPVPVKIP